jgi:hypothetical protein
MTFINKEIIMNPTNGNLEPEAKLRSSEKVEQPANGSLQGRTVGQSIKKILSAVAKLVSRVYQSVFKKKTVEDYEQGIRDQFNAEAELILAKLKEGHNRKQYYNIVKRLHGAHLHERPIITLLITDATTKQWQEILKGGHVHVRDGGILYEQLKKNSNARVRYSSHPSTGPQYAIRGNFLSEHLFGQHLDELGRYSWFQLENHPMTFGHWIRHMIDYVKYKATGKNQGPHGSSIHTDRKPIILTPAAGA